MPHRGQELALAAVDGLVEVVGDALIEAVDVHLDVARLETVQNRVDLEAVLALGSLTAFAPVVRAGGRCRVVPTRHPAARAAMGQHCQRASEGTSAASRAPANSVEHRCHRWVPLLV